MIHDFFLVERADQIQRLRDAKSGPSIDIPGRLTRIGYSAVALDLFRLVDSICDIPLRTQQTRMGWLLARSGEFLGFKRSEASIQDESEVLAPQHRELLNTFERELVQKRLGDDADAATIADAIIKAILGDREHFFGLKPLQVHSENFTYEFLFPSHLNLYTALTTPGAQPDEPRFAEDQIQTIFRFLSAFEENGESPDAELVGAMTLAANRLSLRDAEQLIQRMIDLCSCPKSVFHQAAAVPIRPLRDAIDAAIDLLRMIQAVVVVECSICGDQLGSKYKLASDLPQFDPLPACLEANYRSWQAEPARLDDWTKLVRRLSRVAIEAGGVDSELDDVLNSEPDRLLEILALAAPGADASRALSRVSQRLLAKLLQRCKSAEGKLDLETLRGFSRHIAPRLNWLPTEAAAVFEAEFLANDDGRRQLLRAAKSESLRRKIVERVVDRARKRTDALRLLCEMMLAASIDPSYTTEQLQRMARTITVVRLLQHQGYISTNQLAELTKDLRQRLPDSIEFLAAPRQARTANPVASRNSMWP